MAFELQNARDIVINGSDNKKRAYYAHENQRKTLEAELKAALEEIDEIRAKGLMHDDLKK